MEVTIYIDVYHTGHLSKGTGAYNIMIEFILKDGKPETREYYEGLRLTTKNRTALKACIVALSHLKKPCNVKLVTNSLAVVNAINQNWNKTKNVDLWQQLLELMEVHNVTYEYELTNPYSSYMHMTARKKEIQFEEDKNNV